MLEPQAAATGVGRIVSSIPGCKVLCVYLRSEHQDTFSDMPPFGDAVRVELAAVGQAPHLEAAAVGQDRPPPAGEGVQPPQPLDPLDAGA